MKRVDLLAKGNLVHDTAPYFDFFHLKVAEILNLLKDFKV